jgi:hypothetical protein
MANGIASRPSSATSLSFHPFSRLPTELRLKIFSFVEPPHRMIKIRSDDILPLTVGRYGSHEFHKPQRGENQQIIHHRVKISALVPAVLQVCFESRNAFIDRYLLLLSVPTANRPVRVNLALDTFFFPDRAAYASFERAYYENLKYGTAEWSLIRTSLRKVAQGDEFWTLKLPFPNLTSIIAKDWRNHQTLSPIEQRVRAGLSLDLVDLRGRDASLPKLVIHHVLKGEFERMVLYSQPRVSYLHFQVLMG